MESLIIYADHAPHQGLGHLNRCMNVAKAFKDQVGRVEFIVQTESARDFVIGRGFECRMQNVSDIHVTKQQFILIDSYTLPYFYYENFRSNARALIVVDDLADRPLTADIYVNHNLFAQGLNLDHIDAGHFLLGIEYALVHRQFKNLAYKQTSSPLGKDVFICFGGTDKGQYSKAVIREMRGQGFANGIRVFFNDNKELDPSMRQVLRQDYSVNARFGVSLYEELEECAVLICGAGQTSLEALVSHASFVAISIAANQDPNAKALRGMGCDVFDTFDPKKIARQAIDVLGRDDNEYTKIKQEKYGPDMIVASMIGNYPN